LPRRSRLLRETEAASREPLHELKGLLHDYVGIDRELGHPTDVSVWETLEEAHEMDSLEPMLAERPILQAAGASFETITNYETLWTITP
jgi:hypothetical protein